MTVTTGLLLNSGPEDFRRSLRLLLAYRVSANSFAVDGVNFGLPELLMLNCYLYKKERKSRYATAQKGEIVRITLVKNLSLRGLNCYLWD